MEEKENYTHHAYTINIQMIHVHLQIYKYIHIHVIKMVKPEGSTRGYTLRI